MIKKRVELLQRDMPVCDKLCSYGVVHQRKYYAVEKSERRSKNHNRDASYDHLYEKVWPVIAEYRGRPNLFPSELQNKSCREKTG